MATTDYALDVAGRFWAHVDKSGDCWLWTGYRNQKGYGVMAVANRKHPAHRVAWALSGRNIGPFLTLDHLCRNRACVNPGHMEPVTNRENVLRGDTLPAANLAKTECPGGHPFDSRKADGARYCLVCAREQNRERTRRGYVRPSRRKAGEKS